MVSSSINSILSVSLNVNWVCEKIQNTEMWGKFINKKAYLTDRQAFNFHSLRSRADLNRCTQFCRLVPNRSATRPSWWQKYNNLFTLSAKCNTN